MSRWTFEEVYGIAEQLAIIDGEWFVAEWFACQEHPCGPAVLSYFLTASEREVRIHDELLQKAQKIAEGMNEPIAVLLFEVAVNANLKR